MTTQVRDSNTCPSCNCTFNYTQYKKTGMAEYNEDRVWTPIENTDYSLILICPVCDEEIVLNG